MGVSINDPQEFHDEYHKNKLDKLSFAIQFFLSWNVLPLIRTDATSPHLTGRQRESYGTD